MSVDLSETGVYKRAATFGAGPNAVLPVFEAFQSARVEFAQEVAKLALPASISETISSTLIAKRQSMRTSRA